MGWTIVLYIIQQVMMLHCQVQLSTRTAENFVQAHKIIKKKKLLKPLSKLAFHDNNDTINGMLNLQYISAYIFLVECRICGSGGSGHKN